MIVNSTKGEAFRLLKTKVKEVAFDPYSAKRSDLCRALRASAKTGGYVDTVYSIEYFRGMQIVTFPATARVLKYANKISTVKIGCKLFTRKDAVKLYRWATR
jgi:hypothetical protein